MKTLIKNFVSALLASAALTLTMATPAKASTHGCTVLLCLASTTINPMSIPECVGPLTQFWSDLWHGHGFPSCPEAGPGNGFANLVYEEFLPCPNGTTDLAAGTYVDASIGNTVVSYGSTYFQGSPYRACGGNFMGTVQWGSHSAAPYYQQYDSIQFMPVKPNPWFFNVMVNGSINNVIR